MAQANFTEDEDQKTFKKIDCSAEFYTRGVNGELIFLSSVNIILSIAAFLGNTLILVALNRGSQWGGGFYGYRLKFWLFYGYRLIFFSYG